MDFLNYALEMEMWACPSTILCSGLLQWHKCGPHFYVTPYSHFWVFYIFNVYTCTGNMWSNSEISALIFGWFQVLNYLCIYDSELLNELLLYDCSWSLSLSVLKENIKSRSFLAYYSLSLCSGIDPLSITSGLTTQLKCLGHETTQKVGIKYSTQCLLTNESDKKKAKPLLQHSF